MGAHFRVYGIDGTTYLGRLPEFSQATVQEEYNGPGSVQIDYPKRGAHSDLLDLDEAVLVLVDDGEIQPDYYLLEDDNDDPAKQPVKGNVVTFGGRGALALLEDAIIYPRDHNPGGSVINLDPIQDFGDASPGTIMKVLIDKAKARGTLTGITYDFTETNDSAGNPWPMGYTIIYDAGSDYLKTLQDMSDNGWADFRMSGMTLQMYAPDTVLATDRPDVIFRLGREVTQGPRIRSRRTKRSTMLLVGDEGALAEQHAVGYSGRRREAYDGRGGVTDLGTLAALGDTELAGMVKASEGITLACAVGSPSTPKPGVDYFAGDYVRYDQRRLADDSAYEPMRVRTIARVFTPDGVQSISIELNDLVVEASTRLARKIDAIVNGSTSNSRAPQPAPEGVDNTIPAAPLAVDVSSAAYTQQDGTTRAIAAITWPAVLTNTDGSQMDDFGAYYVEYALGLPGDNFVGDWLGPFEWHDVTFRLTDLPSGVAFRAQVQAADFNGNRGGWTASEQIFTAVDDIPPDAPSTPTLTPVLGALRVDWDGLDFVGDDMAIDTAAVQVLVSDANNFGVDDPGVRVADTLQPGPGWTLIPGTSNETLYVRLVAFDTSGNRSDASTIASATVQPLVAADINDGAITNAKIATDAIDARTMAAGAVATAEIAAGAVTAAQIADAAVQAAKIATSAVNADAIADAAIVTAKIADAAIVTAKIGDAAITNAKIGTLAVGTANIADAAIVTAKIGTAQVGSAQIANLAVTTAQIADGTIITAKIGDATITNAKIVDGTIDHAKIASVDAGAIQTGFLGATMTVSGSIKTATSGARTELNATGLQAFATDGFTKVLEIKNADGSLTGTGVFQNGSPSNYVALNVYGSVYPALVFKTPNSITSGMYSWESGSGTTLQAGTQIIGLDTGVGNGALYLVGPGPDLSSPQGYFWLNAANGDWGGLAKIIGTTNGTITFSIQPLQGGATTDIIVCGTNVGSAGPGVVINGNLWMTNHTIYNATLSSPTLNSVTIASGNFTGSQQFNGNSLNGVGQINNGAGTISFGSSLSSPSIVNGGSWSGSPTINSPTLNSPTLAGGTTVTGAGIGMNGTNLTGMTGMPSNAGTIVVVASGTLSKQSASSERYKKNIRTLADPRRILKAEAVQFKYRRDIDWVGPDETYWGLIAEQVWQAGLDEIVIVDPDVGIDNVDYARGWVPLLPIVKEHDEELVGLRRRVEELEKELASA